MDPLIRFRVDDTLISLAQLDSIKLELDKGGKNDPKNELIDKANDLVEKIRQNIPKISLFGNYVSAVEGKYLKQINQRYKIFSNWFKNYQKSIPKIEKIDNPTTSQSIIKQRSKSVGFKGCSLTQQTINDENDSQIESIECSLNEDRQSNPPSIFKKSQNSIITSKPNKMPVVIVSKPKRKRARSHAHNDSLKEFNLDINLNDESNSINFCNNNSIENKGLRIKLIQNNELLPLSFASVCLKDLQLD